MAQQPSTGHVKNIAGFESLITFCVAHGAAYSPSREALQTARLLSLLDAAKASLVDCKAKEIAYDNAVDARIMVFKDLRALATRVVNALVVSGVSPKIAEAAKTINRKVQGTRAPSTPVADPEATDVRTVSSSKQSFDHRIEEFNALIELVRTQPEYNPNEDALKVDNLTALLAQLRASNSSVAAPYTAWSNSRIHRNNLLYATDTGLVDLAMSVKNYLKAAFGAGSPEYGQVKGIAFRNLR